MTSGHADLRPKALRYAEQLNKVEAMMVEAMPGIIAKLASMALEGKVPAARLLLDRLYGRPPILKAPTADDRTVPYTQADWKSDVRRNRRQRREFKSAVAENIETTHALTRDIEAMRPKPQNDPFSEKFMQMLNETVRLKRESGMDVPDPVPWDVREVLMKKYNLDAWDPTKVPIEEIPPECRPKWS